MDHLEIKRGQIIGIPQIVDLLEESKAEGIKSYILGLMQQPGVLLSSEDDGSWGDDLLVSEVNPTHVRIAPGRAISAVFTGGKYTDCNLIAVPDALETEHEEILLPPAWIDKDPRYVYIEYTEIVNPNKNVTKWDDNWIDNGEIYQVKSFIVHFETARLVDRPWVLLASVIRHPSRLDIEDLRGENVFKLKPTFMEPVAPPTPPIWLKTGWEREFVGPSVQARIVDPPAEIRKAYVLVRWGDEGTGISEPHSIQDLSKTWPTSPAGVFTGQWVTIVNLARRFKVTYSDVNTLYFEEAIPSGQSYHYVVGPDADEYVVHTEYVDDENNRIPLIDPDGGRAFPRSDFSIQGIGAPNYRIIGGLTPGLRLQAEVVARNRLLCVKESHSALAYIITGWGDPPVQPLAFSAEFEFDKLKLHIGYATSALSDISGFETYMQINQKESTPYVDGSGQLLPAELKRQYLISDDKRTDFTVSAVLPEAGAWIHLFNRAYDGAGQFSDYILYDLYARIKKAPKPKGLLVATGVTEEDEQDQTTLALRREKGMVGIAGQTTYIYAIWAEKSMDWANPDGGSIRIRVARVTAPNKVRVEQIGHAGVTPGVKWSDGAWNDYVCTIIDRETNRVESRKIVSTVITAEGFGDVTLDADLKIFLVGETELDYILHPGAGSYLAVLEPIDRNMPVDASDFSTTLYGRATLEDVIPLVPSGILQKIVDDRDNLIPIVPVDPGDEGEHIVVSNQVYFQVPFAKKYRVKVAGMYGTDERTMSAFIVSGDITAGIRVDPAPGGFDCQIQPETGPNYIILKFTVHLTGVTYRTLQIVSGIGRTSKVNASWDSDEIQYESPRSEFRKTYNVGYDRWLCVRIRALLSKGGYTDDVVIVHRSDKIIHVVDDIVQEKSMGHSPVTT